MFGRGNNAKAEKENINPDDLEATSMHRTGETTGGSRLSVVPDQCAHQEGTLIGEGLYIEGNISGTGNIVIDGEVKGNVEVKDNSITIGRKGRVEGEIIARAAKISGHMDGKIAALESVNITRSADVCGEVKAGRISIDDGAFFKGKIELDREPTRKIIPAGMRAGKTGENEE
jgi:cytoskeletal protein CcmA (bactofilin family)